MITNILNVEKIEKSIEEISLQAYNLSPVVNNVCKQFTKSAKAKELQINTSIDDNVIALVDERYVIQVIENLLSNAIKFSPPGKSISVFLTREPEKCLMEIKDEGPGLSEKDKSKLFQRFQRLSAKPTANESSTGLGLSIVKKFVESMKGKIWCESKLGEGASFFVELQLVKSSD